MPAVLDHTRGWAQGLFDLMLPLVCSACGERLEAGDDTICRRCRASIEQIGRGVCPLCGHPTPRAVGRRCPNCPPAPVHFDSARAAFLYRGAFAEMFRSFKYGHRLELGLPLARAMFMALRPLCESEDRPDLLIPVPLHFLRGLRRGYNQSEVIAEEFARLAGIECAGNVLLRVRYTPAQSLQPPERRWRNVRGAFEVAAPDWVRERRIGLVDDVLTTGNTVNECARTLKGAGAAHVAVIALARA
ncbi:MAG TPA: ComF family protein [Sumerlaeia bacterium]|nr:ComF family protein [Sumerlaeia bacterium]